MDNFSLLNEAFKYNSFYIIGAGASAGLIPMTHEQGGTIFNRYFKFGMFSLNEGLLDEGAKRLLGSMQYAEDQIELVNRINPGAVRAIAMQLMTPGSNIVKKPYQYIVFKLAKEKSVVFSLNVDSLATKYCGNHYIFYPHGKLNPALMQSNSWNEIIDICLHYSLEPPKIPGLLLPQKEPFGITNGQQYKACKYLFPYMNYIVLIGYSFGFDGNELDDCETFDFFKNLLKSYKKPIIVIDPFRSEKIAEMLREEFKNKQVYEISAYWEYLSQAKIVFEQKKILFPHDKNLSKQDLYYIYSDLIDKNAYRDRTPHY